MSTAEQIWFIVGVSGFIFVLEGAFHYVIKKVIKGKLDENIIKVAFGVFVFALALIMLFNLPNE